MKQFPLLLTMFSLTASLLKAFMTSNDASAHHSRISLEHFFLILKVNALKQYSDN